MVKKNNSENVIVVTDLPNNMASDRKIFTLIKNTAPGNLLSATLHISGNLSGIFLKAERSATVTCSEKDISIFIAHSLHYRNSKKLKFSTTEIYGVGPYKTEITQFSTPVEY